VDVVGVLDDRIGDARVEARHAGERARHPQLHERRQRHLDDALVGGLSEEVELVAREVEEDAVVAVRPIHAARTGVQAQRHDRVDLDLHRVGGGEDVARGLERGEDRLQVLVGEVVVLEGEPALRPDLELAAGLRRERHEGNEEGGGEHGGVPCQRRDAPDGRRRGGAGPEWYGLPQVRPTRRDDSRTLFAARGPKRDSLP
jgi:hypothetical protein